MSTCDCGCPANSWQLLQPHLTRDSCLSQGEGIEGSARVQAHFAADAQGAAGRQAVLAPHKLYGRFAAAHLVKLEEAKQFRTQVEVCYERAGVSAPAALSRAEVQAKAWFAHHRDLALLLYIESLQRGSLISTGSLGGPWAQVQVQEACLQVSTSCLALVSRDIWHGAVEPHALRCNLPAMPGAAQHRGVVLCMPNCAAYTGMGLATLMEQRGRDTDPLMLARLLYHQIMLTALLLGDAEVDVIRWSTRPHAQGVCDVGAVEVVRVTVDTSAYLTGGRHHAHACGSQRADRRCTHGMVQAAGIGSGSRQLCCCCSMHMAAVRVCRSYRHLADQPSATVSPAAANAHGTQHQRQGRLGG